MGSFSIWHWLIVLVIVMLVFGTKKPATSARTSAVRSRASKGQMKEAGRTGWRTRRSPAADRPSTRRSQEKRAIREFLWWRADAFSSTCPERGLSKACEQSSTSGFSELMHFGSEWWRSRHRHRSVSQVARCRRTPAWPRPAPRVGRQIGRLQREMDLDELKAVPGQGFARARASFRGQVSDGRSIHSPTEQAGAERTGRKQVRGDLRYRPRRAGRRRKPQLELGLERRMRRSGDKSP